MSRVYVPQKPTVMRDGKFVSKYDISPARVFGEIIYVLPPGNLREDDATDTYERIQHIMDDYRPEDSILAVGDPLVLVMVTTAAAMVCDDVSLLKWDRLGRCYKRQGFRIID